MNPRGTMWINKYLFWVLCLVVVMSVTLFWFRREIHTLNCTQLRAQGKVNIQKSSRDYTPLLDRNHDNIACNE